MGLGDDFGFSSFVNAMFQTQNQYSDNLEQAQALSIQNKHDMRHGNGHILQPIQMTRYSCVEYRDALATSMPERVTCFCNHDNCISSGKRSLIPPLRDETWASHVMHIRARGPGVLILVRPMTEFPSVSFFLVKSNAMQLIYRYLSMVHTLIH